MCHHGSVVHLHVELVIWRSSEHERVVRAIAVRLAIDEQDFAGKMCWASRKRPVHANDKQIVALRHISTVGALHVDQYGVAHVRRHLGISALKQPRPCALGTAQHKKQ